MTPPRPGTGWGPMRLPIVLVALLVAGNVTAYVAWTRPHWSEVAAATSASREGQRAEEALAPALERARGSYGQIAEAEAGLDGLRRRVRGSTGTVADAVAAIRAAVTRSGLDGDRVNYRIEPVPELGLLQLQVDLPVSGSYARIRRLVHEIEAGEPFVALEQVAVAAGTEDDGELLVQLTTSAFVVAPEVAATMDEAMAGADAGPPGGASDVAGAPPSMLTAGLSPLDVSRRLRARLDGLAPPPVQPGELILDLVRLDTARPAAAQPRRNLFAFAGSGGSGGLGRGARDSEDGTDPDWVPEPVMPYGLLGIIDTVGGRLATLAEDEAIHVVKVGDTLPNGMRVAEVGNAHVVLEAGPTRTRLSLRKNE